MKKFNDQTNTCFTCGMIQDGVNNFTTTDIDFTYREEIGFYSCNNSVSYGSLWKEFKYSSNYKVSHSFVKKVVYLTNR